jgi:hypothetical protein
MPTVDPTTMQLIDLTFMATYERAFGFRYNIECITGLQETGKMF